jgi:hypothetical protein
LKRRRCRPLELISVADRIYDLSYWNRWPWCAEQTPKRRQQQQQQQAPADKWFGVKRRADVNGV